MEPSICFQHARLIRNSNVVEEDLWVKQRQIIGPQRHADIRIDANGDLIAPGYIDLQINGGFGFDFSSGKDDAIFHLIKKLPQHGVTSFLATLVTSSPSVYHRLLSALKPPNELKGANLLGIHLEGPYLNPTYCGAHDPKLLQATVQGWDSLMECYGNLEGVRLITLAPEIEGILSLIPELKRRGILVSLGHSGADFSIVNQAIEKGATLVTHLYNAMSLLHHRNVGIIGAALLNRSLSYSLIADGHHVHKEALQLAWKAHAEGLFLISDATSALGVPRGEVFLGNQKLQAKGEISTIPGTDTLAGTALGLDEMVRRFKKMTGCSSIEAIEAASHKPARVLGLHQKGNLNIGSDADFIFLDENLNVKKSYVAGKKVYEK